MRRLLVMGFALGSMLMAGTVSAFAGEPAFPAEDEVAAGSPAPEPVDPRRPLPGTIALTFDDGPDPKWTPYILDVLDRLDVVATFFVAGFRVEWYPEIAQDIVERGHSLQNHSYGHGNLTELSDSAVRRDVERGTQVIVDAAGVLPTCMRPPYGATSSRTTQIIEELGLHVVIWDENSADYAHQSSSVLRSISHRWEDGESVLMHDIYGFLYDEGVLEDLVAEVRSRDLGFSVICENIRQPSVFSFKSLVR